MPGGHVLSPSSSPGSPGMPRERPADATAERVEEITVVLGGLTGNEIVSGVWSGETSQRVVMEAAGAALASAVGRD